MTVSWPVQIEQRPVVGGWRIFFFRAGDNRIGNGAANAISYQLQLVILSGI